MRHDGQVTMCSLEWLEHERRKAWQEGYTAGWKDQECDMTTVKTGDVTWVCLTEHGKTIGCDTVEEYK